MRKGSGRGAKVGEEYEAAGGAGREGAGRSASCGGARGDEGRDARDRRFDQKLYLHASRHSGFVDSFFESWAELNRFELNRIEPN